MYITDIRSAWPENSGFIIDRPNGLKVYTFLHFINSVDIYIDGKIITTKPGACLIYDIDTPQLWKSNVPLMHDWMHMTEDFKHQFEFYGLKTDKVFYLQNSQLITSIMREIEMEFLSNKKYSDKLIEAKANELFIKVARSCKDSNSEIFVNAETKNLFYEFRSKMFSRLYDDWNVENMAKCVNLSQSRFYRIYKSVFGITPTEDLILAKVNAAKNYLTFTSLTIPEICEKLGYNDSTHFNRQFKKVANITPGQYRKSNS